MATSDRRIDLVFVLNAPRVILFGNLLAPQECDQMIELSRRKLQRSTVVNASTGAYDVYPDCTSSGTHLGANPTTAVDWDALVNGLFQLRIQLLVVALEARRRTNRPEAG